MSYEKDKILEFNFNQYMKSDKIPYINLWWHWIFSKKVYGCANDLENSSTTKIDEHIPWGYSMPTIFAFNNIENKHTLYHGEVCTKIFCESLRRHVKSQIFFFFFISGKAKLILKRKKRLPLAKEELKPNQDANVCYICRKIIFEKVPSKYKLPKT